MLTKKQNNNNLGSVTKTANVDKACQGFTLSLHPVKVCSCLFSRLFHRLQTCRWGVFFILWILFYRFCRNEPTEAKPLSICEKMPWQPDAIVVVCRDVKGRKGDKSTTSSLIPMYPLRLSSKMRQFIYIPIPLYLNSNRPLNSFNRSNHLVGGLCMNWTRMIYKSSTKALIKKLSLKLAWLYWSLGHSWYSIHSGE